MGDSSSGRTSTPYIPDPRHIPLPPAPAIVAPALPSADVLTAWVDPSSSLRSLPADSVAGAFIPLRRSVHVESSAQWAVFDYGIDEKNATPVAFCLHRDCKEGRKTNPTTGLFAPAVEGSMNRHWRSIHQRFEDVDEEKRQRATLQRARREQREEKENEKGDKGGEGGNAKKRQRAERRPFLSSSMKGKADVPNLSTSLAASAVPPSQPYNTPPRSAASTPTALSSSSSSPSSSASSSSGGVRTPPTAPTGAPRRALRPRARPYLLFARVAEVFAFFASLLRLQWGYIAERFAELSSANRLGYLIWQTHIVNEHRHRVTFQTAAGLISDNDSECPCKPGRVERITRVNHLYQCIVRCAACKSEMSWTLDTAHHWRLSDDLDLKEMTAEEERAHEEREGYRRPPLRRIIPVEQRAGWWREAELDEDDEEQKQSVEHNAENNGHMQLH